MILGGLSLQDPPIFASAYFVTILRYIFYANVSHPGMDKGRNPLYPRNVYLCYISFSYHIFTPGLYEIPLSRKLQAQRAIPAKKILFTPLSRRTIKLAEISSPKLSQHFHAINIAIITEETHFSISD